jgi:5-methylcytosine-specific restriction endonuclease McrA
MRFRLVNGRVSASCASLRFAGDAVATSPTRVLSSVMQVLVLNASFEPLNVCSVRRAHVLVFKGKAEVIEELARPLRSATHVYQWPHVIRLQAYVRVPRPTQRRISRRALFARDGWRCQYCGSSGKLTLDHVVPRSRGGVSDWENVVASCAPCNLRKGDRLPDEAQMPLRELPRVPAPAVFIALASTSVPEPWRPYLVGHGVRLAAPALPQPAAAAA